MALSPDGPAEVIGGWAGGGGQYGEQVLDLIAGQRNQLGWGRVVVAFVCGGCGQEGMGEHREGDQRCQDVQV
ncbi:hypothetical protein AB0D38_17880 [Streptomyces sp. NPDC048279]|uniref:hypothetical protein n=1 Tax=Streptomyces sp. NPDC048279 TaxID=3154714 RepID=UPI00343B3F8A